MSRNKGTGKSDVEKVLNNIPIKEDKDLLNLLSEIDVGQEVPESLYKVVAELLAWVYQLNQNFPQAKQGNSLKRTE